jgi:hypothetical protein
MLQRVARYGVQRFGRQVVVGLHGSMEKGW